MRRCRFPIVNNMEGRGSLQDIKEEMQKKEID
jgi:hypothetical protein